MPPRGYPDTQRLGYLFVTIVPRVAIRILANRSIFHVRFWDWLFEMSMNKLWPTSSCPTCGHRPRRAIAGVFYLSASNWQLQ